MYASHFSDILKELLTFLSIPGEHISPLTLTALTFIGRSKPIGDSFPQLLETLAPICKAFVRGRNPKQAKQAIKCLYTNATDTREAVFTEVLESVKNNLRYYVLTNHIFPKAQVTSNKNAHIFRHHSQAHALGVIHFLRSVSLRNHFLVG